MTSVNVGFLLNVTNLNRFLQTCDESWYYMECCSTTFSFNFLSSNKNFLATNTDGNIKQWKDLENDHNISLSLKPSLNLELLVTQFNNTTPENSNDAEKTSSSEYYDIEELKYLTKRNHYPYSM